MKKVLFVLLLCLACVSGRSQETKDSLAFVSADWQVTDLERGAQAMSARINMFGSVQNISVIRYPAGKFVTEIIHRPGEEACRPSVAGNEVSADFTLNGGYFNVRQRTPSVYFRVGKQVYGRTHPTEVYRVDGVLAFKDRKGRKMMIARSDTARYDAVAGRYHSVVASGPVLMLDEEIVVPVIMADVVSDEAKVKAFAFFDKRHPRAALGMDDDGYIYLVAIDGRFPGQADGASIYETACICRLLGMTDAINLDGGGSTSLWAEDMGVINYPSDNRKFDHDGERCVPNIIVVR